MASLVDNVEIEDHLHLARTLKSLDRLPGRQVLVEGEDIRVHDAASGLVRILKEVLDLTRVLAPHQLKHLRRQLIGQIPDPGSRVVRRKLLKETRQLVSRVFDQHRRAELEVELAERLDSKTAILA